jgi:hypothetical protein
MDNRNAKYSLGFTSGSLLFKEAEAFISNIKDETDFIKGDEDIDRKIIPLNSESSQKRIKRELDNRLRGLQSPELILQYKTSDEANKKLILFYSACKVYPIISDFMLEVVLNKWYNLDIELSTDDFQNFLYRKMDNHPELLKITERTRTELSNVTLRMLRELGLTKNKNLQKLYFDSHVLKNIVRNGDSWFLEILLLSEAERNEIIEK